MINTLTHISLQHTDKRIESYNKKRQLIHVIENKEIQSKIAVHRWFGSATDEEIKEIMDGPLYTFLEEQKLSKILIDTSKMNGFFDGVNQWLAAYYIPKLLKIGIKYNAYLLSEDFYACLADDLDEPIQGAFVTHMFGSEEKALKWLKSMK
jgi:hypothetical protein